MKFICGDRTRARCSAPLQQHRHHLNVVSQGQRREVGISPAKKTRGGTGLTTPVSCGSIGSETAEDEKVTSPQLQLSVLPPRIPLPGKQGHTRHPGTLGIWKKYLQAIVFPHSYTVESEAICSWLHHLVFDLAPWVCVCLHIIYTYT